MVNPSAHTAAPNSLSEDARVGDDLFGDGNVFHLNPGALLWCPLFTIQSILIPASFRPCDTSLGRSRKFQTVQIFDAHQLRARLAMALDQDLSLQ